MGGSGSTRWDWHNKRATVESCRRFTLREVLSWGRWRGSISWTRGGQPNGSISYQVHYSDDGQPQRLQLTYTITYHDDRPKVDIDYSMPIVSTPTPWGASRYWLLCPDCGRRCGTLYDDPHGQRYTCRLCGKLTYTTCQESHKANILAELMGPEFANRFPTLTPGERGKLLECQLSSKEIPKRILQKIRAEVIAELLEEWANRPDPHTAYLTPAAICERSGLSLAELATLRDARLLIPDHGDLYRPKLGGWACKLAYLLRDGWELAEVKAWARGRWSTPDPRAWPPDQADWCNLASV